MLASLTVIQGLTVRVHCVYMLVMVCSRTQSVLQDCPMRYARNATRSDAKLPQHTPIPNTTSVHNISRLFM